MSTKEIFFFFFDKTEGINREGKEDELKYGKLKEQEILTEFLCSNR